MIVLHLDVWFQDLKLLFRHQENASFWPLFCPYSLIVQVTTPKINPSLSLVVWHFMVQFQRDSINFTCHCLDFKKMLVLVASFHTDLYLYLGYWMELKSLCRRTTACYHFTNTDVLWLYNKMHGNVQLHKMTKVKLWKIENGNAYS